MATARSVLLVSVDVDRFAKCRSCGRSLVWARTPRGRNLALDAKAAVHPLADGSYEVSSDFVHWATCPKAAAFRRKEARRASETID